MLKNVSKGLIMAMAALAFLSGCESDERNARIQVWLTDAPGDYQEVNIDVQEVQINASESGNGWQSLNTAKGVYNLLELTNGLDTLLGEIEVPAGRISQIRLVLGENNTVKIGDEIFSLSTPSAQQSGLKLNVQEEFTDGIVYKILLDFDVARSIVRKGNGGYSLKPVIRTIVEAQSGAIEGQIDPAAAHPAVYAISGEDTLGTTFSDEEGHFLLRGIPAGQVVVSFAPATGFLPVQKNDVTVTTGQVTQLGLVEIPVE